MLNSIYTKIFLVFTCLYIFLVGISGLSKSISGLTTPSELSIGDMAQLKKQTLIINGQEIQKKKIWVKIIEIDAQQEQYIFEYSENDIKTIGKTTKKNIKKVASSNFINATSSRFISLFIGVFATVLFQSSSTTTSLIVGMAGGGLIGLSSAVPMVMGANIGTTVTNTLVSLGHIRRKEEFKRAFASSTVHDFFNMLAVIIFFPLEIMFGFLEKSATFLGNFFFTEITEKPFQSPIKQAVSWGVDHLKYIVKDIVNSDWALLAVSVLITLLMLFSIVKLLRSMVLEKVEQFFDQYIFKTALRALVFGFILTILVQSSSITTSTIVPLAGAGVLSLRQIFPFTLGANIGTTITSIMAALVLNPIAMVVAFSHLLFNILAIIIIYPIKQLREIPLLCAEKLAELSIKNKLAPILYLGIVFVLIPIIIILLGG
jgi:sodium-dependent phosphate cotransporter